MILDEGHVIRNCGSKQAKAACLLKAERRWVISGTPVQNTLNDLYRCVEQDEGRGGHGKGAAQWTGKGQSATDMDTDCFDGLAHRRWPYCVACFSAWTRAALTA